MTGTGRNAFRLADARREDDRRLVATLRPVDSEPAPRVAAPRSVGAVPFGWLRRRILGHA